MKNFNFNKFYVLGCGNMGGNLLSSFLKNNKLDPSSVTIIHPCKEQRESLENCFKCEAKSLEKCEFQNNDLLFIGLKPKSFLEQANHIKQALNEKEILCISIMASISSDSIKEKIGIKNVIRLMPNLAVKIGKGVTGILSSKNEFKEDLKYLLKDSGLVIDLKNDEEIASITALSGSGPAFFYYFLEAMIEAGVNIGFTKEISRNLVLQTISGAIDLISYQKLEISELRKLVTSKGGTTETGLNLLSKNNFFDLISKTIEASKIKASS